MQHRARKSFFCSTAAMFIGWKHGFG